jgi:hypothetical protein
MCRACYPSPQTPDIVTVGEYLANPNVNLMEDFKIPPSPPLKLRFRKLISNWLKCTTDTAGFVLLQGEVPLLAGLYTSPIPFNLPRLLDGVLNTYLCLQVRFRKCQ